MGETFYRWFMSAPIIDSLPLPPHSPEAEHALLGALLANPESFHLIEPPLEPGDFYNYANRLIYQAIFSLASQGKPLMFSRFQIY